MDLCMSYIYEADKIIQSIPQRTLYESVFSEDASKTDAEIEKKSEKSFNLLQKAINVIKAIYNKIRSILTDFLDYVHLTADEKKLFKKFEEECKNNPEFANKKVSVKDWKAINAAYDEALKKAEEQMRAEMKKEDLSKVNLAEDIKKKLAEYSSTAGIAMREVTIQQLLNEAKQSKDVAKTLYQVMSADQSTFNVLENQIGEARAKKLTKKLERLSSESKIMRFLAGARKKRVDNEKASFIDSIHTLSDTYKTFHNIEKSDKEHADLYKGIKKTGKQVAKDAGKMSWKDARAAKRDRKQQERIYKQANARNKALNIDSYDD